MLEYSKSLNLPRTDFPMKANLPKREPEILKLWEGLYEELSEDKSREMFVLHDGPPYANGHIHIGHVLNKVLKDTILKFKVLSGFKPHFVPGWDCHGLPIEQQVEKLLSQEGQSKDSISKLEFRKRCREFALSFVNIQKEEFKRLGILADWSNPYLTMDPRFQAQEIRELGRVFKNGLVVRSKKPVYWCIYDKTAEAEAEVEYHTRKDPSIYVKFPLLSGEHLLIWTTTPWTLPANMGAMVGQDFDYVLFKTKDHGVLIFALEALNRLKSELGLEGEVLRTLKGKDLIGLEYLHPINDSLVKVYPSEFVELSTGSGIVHMAPGHGREDFIVGRRFSLEPFAPIDDEGRFLDDVPEFLRGLRVFDANKDIIDFLKKKGLLLYEGKIEHSYPHCWRCKNPVVFRATSQWFISVDSECFREKLISEVEEVNWIPQSGQNRMRSMVETRPDWCISRQRFWGVPITVLYCSSCGHIISDDWLFEKVAKLVESHPLGADVWFELKPEEILPEGFKCPKCESTSFHKEEDILDVWFDSGSSHAFVLRKFGIDRADLYLEGSDQHRGWFQASLLESVASYGKAPYKAVLTHGFVVDESGRKMSKSLGNVVSPSEVISSLGADILRLWCVSEDYTQDVKLGKNVLHQITEDYKKIRNTIRFALGNLYDFDISEAISFSSMHHFDRWIVSTLQEFLKDVYEAYESSLLQRVYHRVRNLCSIELSSIYFDIVKDRLYASSPDSFERKSAQSAIYLISEALICAIAPFLSFTTEEAWQHLRQVNSSLPRSVFLYKLPKPSEQLVDSALLSEYRELFKLREAVLKSLELARKDKLISHSYEAKVYISEASEVAKKYFDYINHIFGVSKVEFSKSGNYQTYVEESDLLVGVDRINGHKCPRCWMYFYEEELEGEVCKRCAKALTKVYERD
ncbi:MAG: isoleucine--tRNA ligase [Aquificaceae bacterium]|nr:isoleucine--tRNA ligase [Aquificaceae bacterium]